MRGKREAQGSPVLPGLRKLWLAMVVTAVVAAGGTFAVTALLVDIFGHKQEARNPFFRVVDLSDSTEDPAIWGMNFPVQYDLYRRTVDMRRTRFGGSEALPRVPDHVDPRSYVAQSRLDEDPRLRTMWAGYPFAVDTREDRGHAYMLEDQSYTERVRVTSQPGACLHCHASTYVPYMEAGGGDLFAGWEKLNQMPFAEARRLVRYPVTCVDCHEPTTMALRITRPAFLEGIKALRAHQGVANYDPNVKATRQEMRSYVCAQCHVEYYFQGESKRLTYPWDNGLRADEILAYYDEIRHKDWIHKTTGAPALKAQHPEYELWSQGVHAQAGVACADCHMPYQRVGALKVSDHHVRSPLLNANNACQTCHKVPEEELRSRVERIQERTLELRDLAMDALVELIGDIEAAQRAGASDERLEAARGHQRRAQFLLDFIEAENSMGFHAPEEAARVAARSIDYTRQGQVTLRASLGVAR